MNKHRIETDTIEGLVANSVQEDLSLLFKELIKEKALKDDIITFFKTDDLIDRTIKSVESHVRADFQDKVESATEDAEQDKLAQLAADLHQILSACKNDMKRFKGKAKDRFEKLLQDIYDKLEQMRLL